MSICLVIKLLSNVRTCNTNVSTVYFDEKPFIGVFSKKDYKL